MSFPDVAGLPRVDCKDGAGQGAEAEFSRRYAQKDAEEAGGWNEPPRFRPARICVYQRSSAANLPASRVHPGGLLGAAPRCPLRALS
jgi:hypothetical protein